MCQRSVHLFFVMQIHILIQLAIRAIALEGAFVVSSSSSSQSGIQYLWDEQRRPLSIASKMVSIVYHNGQFTAWWSLCKREVEVPFSTMASGLWDLMEHSTPLFFYLSLVLLFDVEALLCYHVFRNYTLSYLYMKISYLFSFFIFPTSQLSTTAYFQKSISHT